MPVQTIAPTRIWPSSLEQIEATPLTIEYPPCITSPTQFARQSTAFQTRLTTAPEGDF